MAVEVITAFRVDWLPKLAPIVWESFMKLSSLGSHCSPELFQEWTEQVRGVFKFVPARSLQKFAMLEGGIFVRSAHSSFV